MRRRGREGQKRRRRRGWGERRQRRGEEREETRRMRGEEEDEGALRGRSREGGKEDGRVGVRRGQDRLRCSFEKLPRQGPFLLALYYISEDVISKEEFKDYGNSKYKGKLLPLGL